MKRLSAILLVGALVFGTVGCTNMNKTQQGLLSGAAGGAILGAGLGALTGGSGTTGALIGGGLGARAGGIPGIRTSGGFSGGGTVNFPRNVAVPPAPPIPSKTFDWWGGGASVFP